MQRLGILLSGRGSNFLAIAKAISEQRLPGAEIAVVLSNVEDAPGLAAARELKLPSFAVPSSGRTRAEHDAEMIARLHQHKVELVCLAGYMRIISPAFLAAFPNRILNVHPSLLPAFPGLDAQAQALAHGVRITGCTVHLVDAGLDSGPIVVQRAVEVLDGDTPETLADRILEQEHIAYPEALRLLLTRRWELQGRRLVFLPAPGTGSGS